MRNILKKKVPANMEEHIQSEMAEIKRQAEKELSLKSIDYIIKKREKKFRDDTVVRKADKHLSSGWRRGRSYHMRSGVVLITPTNMRNISWLDLDEYSVTYFEIFKRYPQFHNLIINCNLEAYQLENSELRMRSHRKILESMNGQYFSRVRKCLLAEWVFNKAAALHRQWDVKLFIRYMNSLRKKVITINEFQMKIFPRLLIEHCNDTRIISSYFYLVYRSALYNGLPSVFDNVMEIMNVSYLYFFILHTFNHHRDRPLLPEVVKWLVYELRLVERAFIMGQHKTLQLLLDFGWPVELCMTDGINTRVSWPRVTENRIKVTSISSSLTARYILYLSSFFQRNNTPSHLLADSIRLLWRSVSAPYVSLGDLKRIFELVQQNLLNVGTRGSLPNLYSFLRAYPADCLAIYQPRSLMHLSRCKVRESIDLIGNVNILLLPTTLKDYLHLKW